MQRLFTFCICFILLSGLCLPVIAQEQKKEATPVKQKKEYEDFNKVTEDSKSYQGFFKLYEKKRIFIAKYNHRSWINLFYA